MHIYWLTSGLCVIYTAVHFVYKRLQKCYENTFLIKFYDDTAVVSLLFGDQNGHGPVVSDFVNWCDDTYLCLNVSQTKYLFIDFRRENTPPEPTVINRETVESVDHYKHLVTTIDSKLKFSKNCDIFRKGQ